MKKTQNNQQHKTKTQPCPPEKSEIMNYFFWLLTNQQSGSSLNPKKQNTINEIKLLSSHTIPVGTHPCGEVGSDFTGHYPNNSNFLPEDRKQKLLDSESIHPWSTTHSALSQY